MGEFDLDMPSFGFGHSKNHSSKLSALTWFLFASALWIFLMGVGIFLYHADYDMTSTAANFFLAVAIIGFLIAFIILAMFVNSLISRKTFFETAHKWAQGIGIDNVAKADSNKTSNGLEMSDLLGQYQ